MSNFMFFGGRKQAKTKFSFFFLNLDKALRDLIPGESPGYKFDRVTDLK